MPLVGRGAALESLARVVDATRGGEFQFLAVVGEPGAGKTRLLAELLTVAGKQQLTTLSGRAAEFEQIMPFSVLVDALDDHLESRSDVVARLGQAQQRLLATIFPALEDARGPDESPDRSGMARLRLYRALRQLLDELAGPAGLALILDDVHWADPGTAEFLDHLVRHPPRGKVLVTVAYRPAQAPPRVAALVHAVGGQQVLVGPLGPDEVAEFLGPAVTRARGRALYEASGGNPFYLEALARMERLDLPQLPVSVRAILQLELENLPLGSLRVAQAAATAADEFHPARVAVAAEVDEAATLAALDDLVARDIVRPASAGRFRFRHPLVRQAAYEHADAGWRLGAHARLAAHLAAENAPATAQAHHVERSGTFGDRHAVATLLAAARAVVAQAPETSAHWLRKALELLPVEPATLEHRLELLMELSWALGISGRLTESRDTARELLGLLPADQSERRARAARICALMERQLDRPHEARALLLDELNRMPNPRAVAALPLRVRLVAESLLRVEYRAAQAVLDLMPDSGEGWEPGLEVAVAAMRPMAALAAGRVSDALRTADAAAQLVEASPDKDLVDWLDAVVWLCWADSCMGRYSLALRHFDRVVGLARASGQAYVLTNLLAGQARTLVAVGRLPEALVTAEESVDIARLLRSGQQLVFGLAPLCLAQAWSGDHDAALRTAEEAVATAGGSQEVWAYMARNARGVALLAAGRTDEGIDALVRSCTDLDDPKLDRATLVATAELLVQAESGRGRAAEAAAWAERAAAYDDRALPVFSGLAALARAQVALPADPDAAAASAEEAAGKLWAGLRRIDAGRALLAAGRAYEAAGHGDLARERLREAIEVFRDCGAGALEGQAIRELRRLGVRVTAPPARGDGSYGLSPRELEVAKLVTRGLTNQKIAAELFLSVRTVETHLSRVFAKLGVTSRTGVAAKLARDN